jgi:hypothetical protein
MRSVVGGLFDPARDGVAVARPPGEGLEDEQVDGALQDGAIRVRHR